MTTNTTTYRHTPCVDRAEQIAPTPGDPTVLAALSARDLLAVAERYDAAGDQAGLDAAHTEAERRAAEHPADSLLAQLAGYLQLLVEDTDHDLADEAHTWSRALRRALEHTPDLAPSGPASGHAPGHAGDLALPAPRSGAAAAVRS